MWEQVASLLSADYIRWQKTLERVFFIRRAGEPIVLFVDRDDLHELAVDEEDGPRSLAAAVRSVADVVCHGPSMFARVIRAEQVWRGGDQQTPPPTLPVLALSVFAASEMGHDTEAASHNYYVRLAQALLPDASREIQEQLRIELGPRGGFTSVVSMWKNLGRWLEDHKGARGSSTIPSDPGYFSRIGYPLSQTLMRRSDRAALTRFFGRMDLTRAGIPGPNALLGHLQRWASRRPQGFSERFLQALDDPYLLTLVKPLVYDLATSWNGQVVTPEGLRRLEIRLAIDMDSGEAWWVIPAGRDAVPETLSGSVGGESFTAHVTPDRHTAMYEVQGLPPVSPAVIRSGLSARGSSSIAEFRPSDLLVFVDSADAGGWLSVDAVQAYEELIVAVRPERAAELETVLSVAADGSYQRLKDSYAHELLGGYVIFYDVKFSDKEGLAKASSLLPRTMTKSIEFGTTLRPRLINGLPLFQNVGRNIYLAGGEPDLELPLGGEQRQVSVVLDGEATQEFQASIFPIPFSVIQRGETGKHTVEADGETLRFEVVEGTGSDFTPPGVAGLGWSEGEMGAASKKSVCGALTPVDLTRSLVLIRRAALEYWIADHTGSLTLLSEPAPPTFLPGAIFAYFEVTQDRGCWVLQKRNRGWQVTCLTPKPPSFRRLSTDEQRIWREAVKEVRTAHSLWPQYVAEVERTYGY